MKPPVQADAGQAQPVARLRATLDAIVPDNISFEQDASLSSKAVGFLERHSEAA